MPFIKADENLWRWSASRKLIVGPPNSGKTTSLRTAKTPCFTISSPGEMGVNSLPRGEGFENFVWQASPEDKQDSKSVLNDVRQLAVDIITGKHGTCKTLVVDGVHKLGYYHLDAASNGTWFRGKDFEIERAFGKVDPYSKSYSTFEDFLKLVWFSPIENVIMTSWDGIEPGSFGGVKVDGGRVYPGMHGKLAKTIMGYFSFVLYAQKNFKPVQGRMTPVYEWQIKENKEVAGAAIKLDPALVAKLPDSIPQDFAALDERLDKLMEAA